MFPSLSWSDCLAVQCSPRVTILVWTRLEPIIYPNDPEVWGRSRHNLNVSDWIGALLNRKCQACSVKPTLTYCWTEKNGIGSRLNGPRSKPDGVISLRTSPVDGTEKIKWGEKTFLTHLTSNLPQFFTSAAKRQPVMSPCRRWFVIAAGFSRSVNQTTEWGKEKWDVGCSAVVPLIGCSQRHCRVPTLPALCSPPGCHEPDRSPGVTPQSPDSLHIPHNKSS